MKICFPIALFITLLSMACFAFLGSDDELEKEELFPFEKIVAESEHIIIGSIEVLDYDELETPGTLESIQEKPGLKKYVMKVLPIESLKGGIVEGKSPSKKQYLITINVQGFPSSYLLLKQRREFKEMPYFDILPGGMYVFTLKHRNENVYDLVDNRFSVIPIAFTVLKKKNRENIWDIMLLTLKEYRYALWQHDKLYSFLANSDITKAKKETIKQIHKEYYKEKISELKADLEHEETNPEN